MLGLRFWCVGDGDGEPDYQPGVTTGGNGRKPGSYGDGAGIELPDAVVCDGEWHGRADHGGERDDFGREDQRDDAGAAHSGAAAGTEL